MNNNLIFIKKGDILKTIKKSNIWIEGKEEGKRKKYLMDKGEKWIVIGVREKIEFDTQSLEFDIQSLSFPAIIAKGFNTLNEDRFIIINHDSPLSQFNRFRAVKEKLKKIYN